MSMFFPEKRSSFSGDRFTKPGSMSSEQFDYLIKISSINSEKVIGSLRDFFVRGMSRKEACGKNNVAQGYFSISMKKLIRINNDVAKLSKFYMKSG